ncbi:hypothetical protein ACVXZY_16415 [Staphylococcus aureus]
MKKHEEDVQLIQMMDHNQEKSEETEPKKGFWSRLSIHKLPIKKVRQVN